MKYPQYKRLTVYVMPRHMEFLNRKFYDDGTNRSEQTRQALDLLIAKSKIDDKPDSAGMYEISLTAEEMNHDSVAI